MQIIRSSKECKWISDCAYCGCVFIYKGDEIEVKSKDVEKLGDGKGTTYWVMCPECHKMLGVPNKAVYRKAVNGNLSEWDEEDCYDL